MTAARIIVWRHGRTEWNVEQRFQGQADIPLDSRGVAQAREGAQVLATFGLSAIYASDLGRAFQTATALADVTGLPITTDKRLREIHVGSWEGLLGSEVAEVDPEAAAKLHAGVDVRRSATGESVAEVGERTGAALAEIGAGAEDGSTVVVATHGLSGRAGVCQLVGLPPETWRVFGSLDNCAWTVLEWHRGGGYWRIAEYNVAGTSHVRDTIS
ncbi:MAG: phosphoglycerate mutase family protein [Friedmanniella sp.]|nr:phosphoglycerate mutase family protein [Friedmanniella sp.]